ncbi:selenocysteine lyase-like [Mizuhopecten yessoensis]|uniref:selenocysteine lyase-like n=1 Tax=Mizuhopecten yessoensis TaxID=6573 RepID=UPI000B45AF14|nr:selenocysteine lyase-like [Mizuhopecten yessoensis]
MNVCMHQCNLRFDWIRTIVGISTFVSVELFDVHIRRRCDRASAVQIHDILFTSGGTEANNMILQTALKHFHLGHEITNGTDPSRGDNSDQLPHFITSNMEHDSVKLVLENLAEEGIATNKGDL